MCMMRENLKNFQWHFYGLKCADIDYTVQMVDNIVTDRLNLSKQRAIKILNEGGEGADEAAADFSHYDHVETEYLWHFCLWRLQGIFEGILVQDFISNNERRLFGLKRKIEAVKSDGYSITQEDEEEILEWAKLRNALSHFPPEQYRPGTLNKSDVMEYAKLIKRQISIWGNEKKSFLKGAEF